MTDPTIDRRSLLIGAAAVPAALALPAYAAFDAEPEAAEIERMVAELRRDLMAISLNPCSDAPEGPVVLRCGLRWTGR